MVKVGLGKKIYESYRAFQLQMLTQVQHRAILNEIITLQICLLALWCHVWARLPTTLTPRKKNPL